MEKPEVRICDICKLIELPSDATSWDKAKREAYFFDDNYAVCETHWHGVSNIIGARRTHKKPISVTNAVKHLVKLMQAD